MNSQNNQVQASSKKVKSDKKDRKCNLPIFIEAQDENFKKNKLPSEISKT